MTICLPFTGLQPHLLKAAAPGSGLRPRAGPARAGRRRAGPAPVPAGARRGRGPASAPPASTPTRSAASRVGDVLRLAHPASAPLDVTVDDKTFAHATAGAQGPRLAALIVGTPKENCMTTEPIDARTSELAVAARRRGRRRAAVRRAADRRRRPAGHRARRPARFAGAAIADLEPAGLGRVAVPGRPRTWSRRWPPARSAGSTSPPPPSPRSTPPPPRSAPPPARPAPSSWRWSSPTSAPVHRRPAARQPASPPPSWSPTPRSPRRGGRRAGRCPAAAVPRHGPDRRGPRRRRPWPRARAASRCCTASTWRSPSSSAAPG